jgi:hypothetical protein
LSSAARTQKRNHRPGACATSLGKERTVSGFGLWSILHPRIERYLDDPSRPRHTPREIGSTTAAFDDTATVESGTVDHSSAPPHAASDPLAA